MKRLLPILATLALALAPGNSAAQVFGQLGGAEPVAMNARLFGAYFGYSQNQASLLGQLRLSFHPGVDLGFQGGLSRLKSGNQDHASVDLGIDARTLVARRGPTMPFDVSLGGAIAERSAEGTNLLSVGPTAAASRPLQIARSTELTPYLGIAMLLSRSDAGGSSTTDLSVPVRLGAELKPNPDMRLIAEIQLAVSDALGDNVRLVVGGNFPF